MTCRCQCLTRISYQHIVFLLLYLHCNSVFCQHVHRNATTLAGQPILLNCTVDVSQSVSDPLTIVWLEPISGLPVSVDYNVASEYAGRIQVLGDPRVGQYHLLIRYTFYPQDAGTWTCTSLSGRRVNQKSTLLILVPPSTLNPEVTPDSIDASSDNSLYTFTCTSHYAFPPVNLTWIKESGPMVPYTVSPPRVLVSRTNTYSMSVTLTVTSQNAPSLFACTAVHPTFMGRVGRQTVQLTVDQSMAQSAQLSSHDGRSSVAGIGNKSIQLDNIDRAFLLIAIGIVTSFFVLGLLLSKCNTRWYLDFHLNNVKAACTDAGVQYTSVETMDIIATPDSNSNKTSTTATVNRQHCGSGRHCTCRVIAFTSVAFLLMTSLLFAFPIYLKGNTIPTVATDELTSVFAGGALWLDCTALTQPVQSLVHVTWYRNSELIYYQYYLNDRIIGYPPNSTAGFMFHVRAMSPVVGQVVLWPVAPGEDGIYSCHVASVGGDDETKTQQRIRTFTVFVLMGPVTNYALLVCLSIALCSALFIISLVFHHVIRCQCNTPQSTQLRRSSPMSNSKDVKVAG